MSFVIRKMFHLQGLSCKDAGVMTGVMRNQCTYCYCYSTHPDSYDRKPTSVTEISVQL